MKKIIAIFLGVLLLFSATACSGSKSKTPNADKDNLKETEYYLVKEGKSDYTIVYPSKGTYYENYAVSELQTFFYEATGIMLPAVVDDDASGIEKYISIGNTKLLKDSGIKIDYEEVKETGYKIVTQKANLFLAGGDYAAPSAVYSFLSYQFNYEAFAYDEIYIDKMSGDVKMLEYDLFEKPDLLMVSDYAEITNSREKAIRMQLMRMFDVFLPVESTGRGTFHNFLGIFSPNKYNDKKNHPESYHPEWFSNNQLNLSIAVDEMTDILVEYWKDMLKESVEIGLGTEIAWTFTPMDNWDWSNGQSSLELYEQYNSYAAEYIKFVNVAAKKFNPWVKENYPDRHMRYCIFAYHVTVYPPNKMDGDGEYIKDKNGNYLAADETVVLEDNVTLWYAPINGSFYYSFKEEQNAEWDDVIKRWLPIVGDNPVWYWLYCCNFEGKLVPLDYSHALQTNMQWVKENNGEMLMIESDGGNDPAPNWSKLHLYLQKELGKNLNADVSVLTDKFFKQYYKAASEPMKKFYDEFRAHFAYIAANTDLTFQYMTEPKIAAEENWPYALLNQWLNYIDDAYAAISAYKTSDSALYNKLKDRITLESLTIRYLMLENYSVRLDNQSDYAEKLLDDCMSLGVTSWAGGIDMSSYLKKYFN